ncbi:MAG TPA: hypothetical protein PK156_02355 [Polyangium sp.]|nr:hypothetical protein [Polyangium sp.]
MASFTLDIDEFAAMVGFLNAKKIVGMDERLFASFSEANLPSIMDKLHRHGWMEPADRPNTWHTNEDLVETLAVVVAPHFAILGRAKEEPKSILFYVADKDFVQVVVTNDQVIVTNIADERALGACLATFLDAAFPAEIVVARVRGETFDAGRVALIDERGVVHTSIRGLGPDAEFPWNEGTIAEFVQGAMGELVRT